MRADAAKMRQRNCGEDALLRVPFLVGGGGRKFGNARERVPPGLPSLCLHVVQFTRLAAHRDGDRAAADGAVFDRRIVALRGVDCRREIFAAPRARDFGFDEIGHVAKKVATA